MTFVIYGFISILICIFLFYGFIYKLILKTDSTNNAKYIIWSLRGILTLILFYINYSAFQALGEMENVAMSERDFFVPSILTIVMLIAAQAWSERRSPSYFKSSKEGDSVFNPINFKKPKNVDSNKIGIYIRITVFDVNLEQKDQQDIIFDSSDFEIVSKTFGVFDDLQQSFLVNKSIMINDVEYNTLKIRVDFLNIFDDYSLTGHTRNYTGKDTPYNVQVSVEVEKV